MSLYLDLLILSALGQIIHLGFKARSLQEKARAGNAEFSIVKFLKDDMINIAIAFAFVLILLYLVEDALKLYPKLINYMRGSFAVIGYAGSDLALRAFGKTSKAMNRVIDVNTGPPPEKARPK